MGSQHKASLVSPPPSLKMKVFLSVLALVPLSGLVRGQDSSEYKFRYRVKDAQQGQDFGQVEEKQGENTGGEYQVLLPDGRTQVVSYSASEPAGFLARVEYQGEVTLPDEPLQYLRTPRRLRPAVETLLLADRASLPPAKPVTSIYKSSVRSLASLPPGMPVTVRHSSKLQRKGTNNNQRSRIGNNYGQGPQIMKQSLSLKNTLNPNQITINNIKPTQNTKKVILKPNMVKNISETQNKRIVHKKVDIKNVEHVTSETVGSPVFKTNTKPPKMKYKDSDFKAASTKVLNSLFREDVSEITLKL